MLKLTGAILMGVLVLAFLNPKVFQDWKQKTIEFINPAAKEKRLLNTLDSQINEFGLLINDESLSEKEKIKKINSLIENSHGNISEIENLNDKSDLASIASNFFNKILPGDKEKLSPQPTWLSPNITEAECKQLLGK